MSDTSQPFFLVRSDGPVATISMNRPDRANAMSTSFWRELPLVLRDLEADTSVRCAILAGEGRHFTGGMDLSAFAAIGELAAGDPGRAAFALRDWIVELQRSLTAIERVRFPVIAAIHGACIGGGIDLITACDMRIASRDAYFAVEEINIGMAADVGTLQRLPKLIAPAVAAELCFTGRRFEAEEAKSMGLVSQVAQSHEEMMAAAAGIARSIAERSPLAIAGIKRNLAFSRDHSVADGLDYIATWNAGMLRPQDLMEALAARKAKRAALFSDLMSFNP